MLACVIHLYGTASKEHRLHVEVSAPAHKHPGSPQKHALKVGSDCQMVPGLPTWAVTRGTLVS